ncbi:MULTISPECIES: hypothetical protein [unclassified Ruegeria]|uniref:hypothetical protein n=1 Tax=unclassified Ruegeria TaxID=2625375 RepID=UPI001489843C|nr:MULTISPECIES: hypothetical protein [unclassified Ruegeria]
MRERLLLFGMFGGGLAVFITVILVSQAREQRAAEATPYLVPGSPAMTINMAQELYSTLTPALLLVIYDAFDKKQEDEIYDTLARVTHGDALEYLYLERVGAMAGGGIEEQDQTIHEINLLDTRVDRVETALLISSTWQVIGTVGHSEHLHVRGNTYSADLTISPVEGAWRITDFELLDVDRDTAGEIFPASDEH